MNWNDVKKIIKREVLKEATTVNAGNTKFNLRTGGGRKTLLDGYQLIEEEENPIFKPVEKREPVRELVLEEEEDDF